MRLCVGVGGRVCFYGWLGVWECVGVGVWESERLCVGGCVWQSVRLCVGVWFCACCVF